jgi:hypothetical protein
VSAVDAGWSADDYDPYPDSPEEDYDDDPGDYESPEEYEAAQSRAEEPPDWYLEEEADRRHERHCAEMHGGGECDCPPYVPPRCRLLLRVPRWSLRYGWPGRRWSCGTPGGCSVTGCRTARDAWRVHRSSHEAPF